MEAREGSTEKGCREKRATRNGMRAKGTELRITCRCGNPVLPVVIIPPATGSAPDVNSILLSVVAAAPLCVLDFCLSTIAMRTPEPVPRWLPPRFGAFLEDYGVIVITVTCIILLVSYSLWRSLSCESTFSPHPKPPHCMAEDPLGLSGPSVSRKVGSGSSEIPAYLQQSTTLQGVKQPYDAFLVLDVEGTCVEGSSSFDYPNEIIEWPVCLLRWKDKSPDGIAKELVVVAEFRSFVRPTWRPLLSQFCTNLTGITQDQVDSAPEFTELLQMFETFLEDNGLIEPVTGRRLVRYCWCSDGPFDVRDFVVKQCFISKVRMPAWITGDVLDVRGAVRTHTDRGDDIKRGKGHTVIHAFPLPSRITLSIPRMLQALGLAPFEGRQHSGIDVCSIFSGFFVEPLNNSKSILGRAKHHKDHS
ncbi:uncharacterized protein FIBRA_05002 [Fibroporia radiculosa]|uniref:Exonuclease domain-containing protein n=1 Tax=Fibroporia radiculosa TaxID=599839 RepID=J4G8C1_9APHY|nr:uncharacterized protein FIBRA_05002 [Fibroporia radiculosa]CCM02888.1 predicted protein [Fibroporia radiculosa]